MLKQKGFTIVELLIVIVVIGVLATIAIVAYNGIQTRARVASVSSDLSNSSKKLALYLIDNATYPADLAALTTAGIVPSAGTSFQYTPNNAVSPPTYCITATNSTTSYKITEATTPTSGGCAGHGVGGTQPITNLATNPSLESNSTNWTTNGSYNAAVLSRQTNGGSTGSGYGRVTFGTINNAAAGNIWQFNVPAQPNSTYMSSVYVRASQSKSIALQIFYMNSSGGAISSVTGPNNSITANQWTRISYSFTTPAATVTLWIVATSTGGTLWSAGDTLEADAMMVIDGSSLTSYADGSSSNWVWNGTTNNSSSTGPAS